MRQLGLSRRGIAALVMGLFFLLTAIVAAQPVSAQANPDKPATKDKGYSVNIDGICGHLYNGPWPPPTVRRGSVDTDSNSPVKLAQCYLNWSIQSSFLDVDGRFGQLTEAMVVTFQSPNCANVPPVDGIVGRNTWNALRSWANSPNWAC